MTAPSALPYAEHFGALKAGLPGSDLPWLTEMREAGMESFRARGLPTQRTEAWKYTSLRPLEKLAFSPAATQTVGLDRLPSLLPAGASNHRLVFVNGRFRQDLSVVSSLPGGVRLGSLADHLSDGGETVAEHFGQFAAPDDQPLFALNTAMTQDGLVLRVGRGVSIETPIEVIYLSVADQEPVVHHPRNLIVLEENSRAVVIEHYSSLGTAPSLANIACEISLGSGALLHHYKMQSEGLEAFHLSTVNGVIGRDAHYDGFAMSLGARLSRNEVTLRLAGEGARCHLNGAYMMRGKQHCDNTTVIEHAVPHTSCREVFKGVLDEEARAVFQGRIVVRPDAQHADGHQLSKTMLLSDRAEIDAKPELEIYADDVKCSHGATAGDLDHGALFYLRSRGLPEARARAVLIEAFLTEAVEAIAAEDLCPAFLASIADWLHAE